jgi:Protein of unknown function (DUF3631)
MSKISSATAEEEIPAYAALDEALAFTRRFVQVEEGHELDLPVLVAWNEHCHAIDAFDRTGRLNVTSTLPGTGKSFVLDLCGLLGPEGTSEIMDPSPAGLYARTNTGIPILIDETEGLWNPNGSSPGSGAAKRQASIVNAGYRRTRDGGPFVQRSIGGKLVQYSLFCPIAMAGIGRLPQTTASRCFKIHMAPGDGTRERYIPRDHEGQAVEIGEKLAAWAETYGDEVGCSWPDLPSGLIGRPAEIWTTLLQIADVAGGDWPAMIREAATLAVAEAASLSPVPAPGAELAVMDVRAVWPRTGGHMLQRAATRVILDALRSMDNRPWRGYLDGAGGARKLAALLAITPSRMRLSTTGNPVACYRLEDLPSVSDVQAVQDSEKEDDAA